MLELIKTSRIEDRSEFAAQGDALLNAAFPDGAPNERSVYYSRHGVPTTSMLLSDGGRAVGHLAIYERDIQIGEEALRVGLLGEIAIAADRRGAGLARSLGPVLNSAHGRSASHSCRTRCSAANGEFVPKAAPSSCNK